MTYRHLSGLVSPGPPQLVSLACPLCCPCSLFSVFDELCTVHHVYKVETAGEGPVLTQLGASLQQLHALLACCGSPVFRAMYTSPSRLQLHSGLGHLMPPPALGSVQAAKGLH